MFQKYTGEQKSDLKSVPDANKNMSRATAGTFGGRIQISSGRKRYPAGGHGESNPHLRVTLVQQWGQWKLVHVPVITGKSITVQEY